MCDNQVTWLSAKLFCEHDDNTLVDIKDEEKNNFLTKHTTTDVWTSGNDFDHEGVWRWADGNQAGFTKWRCREPNNAGYNENCLVLIGKTNNDWIKGELYDDPWGHTKAFVCKYIREEGKEIGIEEVEENFEGSGKGNEKVEENLGGSGKGNEETEENYSGIRTGSKKQKKFILERKCRWNR